MSEFMEEMEKSWKKLKEGDIVDCKIISLNDSELLVSFDYISDGVIPKSELLIDREAVINDFYEVDGELKAEIIKMNDGEGNLILSVKKAAQVLVWEEAKKLCEDKTPVDVKITASVKGGVVAMYQGVRAFMPASMLSVAYVEDTAVYVGKTLSVLIKEVNEEDNKIILSHKDIEAKEVEAKRATLFEDIRKDDVFTGKVKKLMDFGAFIDIGGVDGLLHINEMSWKRINHPSDVLKEGQTVEVYITSVDKDKERIGLGLKNIGSNPWEKADELFEVGSIVEGEIVRLTNFGAFVSVADGIDGLVHISEIDHKRINHPSEVLQVGQKAMVKVIAINTKEQKMSLSIKQLLDSDEVDENFGNLDEFMTNEQATTSLESVFKHILKDLK